MEKTINITCLPKTPYILYIIISLIPTSTQGAHRCCKTGCPEALKLSENIRNDLEQTMS